MPKVRIHAFVSGIVQGINFRSNTRRVAQSLGVTGWVKNLPNGRVEVVAEGEEEKIEGLVNFLKRGPFLARIDKLELVREGYKGEFQNFDILH